MPMLSSSGSGTAFGDALLRPAPILLDGGLATQLEAQGCDINNALWSASLLMANTQAIVDASRAYLEAGAECIATASYQASRNGFGALGLSADEADGLMLLSVELALRARDEFLADNPACRQLPLIAASLGPYGAALHDGSEYSGDYDIGADELWEFHRERLRLFDNSTADVLALETIPSLTEAGVLAALLCDTKTPAWVSFSCRDHRHISDGTPLADVAALFRAHPTVMALGINCTPPQFITSLIGEIRNVLPDIAILAYPNSGETYNVTDGTWSGTVSPVDCALAAQDWISAGAKLIGGCCRMGPEHIRAMAMKIEENKQ